MQLVQVDVVSSERPQAGVDALLDPAGAGVPDQVAVNGPEPALGGQDDLVTGETTQRGRQELLGLPEAVGLGGVEKGDTRIDSAPDGVQCRRGIGRSPVATELPGAEGQP